ncbi:MAG: hypothetical protein WAP47_00585 [Candidatus Rokuibacteriota bacterium]
MRWLLYRLGTIPTPHVLFPGIAQYHKYRSDPRKSAIQAKILQLAESHLTRRLFGQILGRIERLAWHPT